MRHGDGTLYHPDGSIFQGQFVFGQATGSGVLNLPNGDHIIGDFYQVSLFQKQHIILKHNFKRFKVHGSKSKQSGTRFMLRTVQIWEFVSNLQGLPHGKMVLELNGKDKRIEGQFRHGMAHGRIRVYQDQKMLYEGLFRMGKPIKAEKMKMDEVPDTLHFNSDV